MTRLVSQEDIRIRRGSSAASSSAQQEQRALLKPAPPTKVPLSRKVSHPSAPAAGKQVQKSLSGRVRSAVSSSSPKTSSSRMVRTNHNMTLSAPSAAFAMQLPSIPKLVNPIETSTSFLKHHTYALRLEADLLPLRPILSRLMQHPAHNRKGLFNSPVDPEALGLADYRTVIQTPMDLGTVKNRLHSNIYHHRHQAAQDIRLVFQNAMRYNPPANYVHVCAQALLETFEQAYRKLPPSKLSPPLEDGQERSSETAVSGQVVGDSSGLSPAAPKSKAQVTFAPMPLSPALEDPQVVQPPMDTTLDSSGTTNTSSAAMSRMNHQPLPLAGASSVSTSLAAPLATPAVVPSSTAVSTKKTSSAAQQPHACENCQGRTCVICDQGCLTQEPPLLICQGSHCIGAKIRKGAQYYISKDGCRQYCLRCYTNIGPTLPSTVPGDAARYKQDLLKRTNDEEIVEEWIQCKTCPAAAHRTCALNNSFAHSNKSFECLACRKSSSENDTAGSVNSASALDVADNRYTFVSGSELPVPLSTVVPPAEESCTADSLQECAISAFIESKVKARMQDVVPNSDKTVCVRVISDCSRHFHVPDVVQQHFRMATESDEHYVKPPKKVNYQQKAIALFQKMDGLDVCIFCMYVQEYDGDDEYESEHGAQVKSLHTKRVYIAYLDSVEYFRPRQTRTEVYHEILVAYLATARERGYHSAQIWACPPSRGNSFVFWNHPASQRTPNKDHLIAWYHTVLSRAVQCGVVTDIKSLYESDFEKTLSTLQCSSSSKIDANPSLSKMACPPLLDGDFWIEEAVRIHSATLARNLKIRPPNDVCVWNVESPPSVCSRDPCPAMQVASLIRDRMMTHPSSTPFHKPVNAAALKLVHYHKIVTKPMDLATAFAKCVMGEYEILQNLVDDIHLMVSNARKFNPVGHFVHNKAIEIQELFIQELDKLTSSWKLEEGSGSFGSWQDHASMSMNLSKVIDVPPLALPVTEVLPKLSPSIVIEDEPSCDGSRSFSSVASLPASPLGSVAASSKEDDASSDAMSLSAMAPAPLPASKPVSRGRKKRRTSLKKVCTKKEVKKLDLLTDGPDAVKQKMVGTDLWILDKRPNTSPKNPNPNKACRKRRRGSMDGSAEDPLPEKRSQSWLGEEVGDSVRASRTAFFTCVLDPMEAMTQAEQARLKDYHKYVSDFDWTREERFKPSSQVADARSSLLELSQFRHLEFNTLRRAKHSTFMLLYHLHHQDAPGLNPKCTTCGDIIEDIRWHKVKKAGEGKRWVKNTSSRSAEASFFKEELCVCCHAKHPVKSVFIPIPVCRTES